MREFLFLLLAAAVIGGGGWALVQRMQAQDALIKDLRARVETSDRLAQSEDRATSQVIERQTVILRERDRAKDEITQAMGSGSVVPAPVWSATRLAIERMRSQAHPGPADRNAGLAS